MRHSRAHAINREWLCQAACKAGDPVTPIGVGNRDTHRTGNLSVGRHWPQLDTHTHAYTCTHMHQRRANAATSCPHGPELLLGVRVDVTSHCKNREGQWLWTLPNDIDAGHARHANVEQHDGGRGTRLKVLPRFETCPSSVTPHDESNHRRDINAAQTRPVACTNSAAASRYRLSTLSRDRLVHPV